MSNLKTLIQANANVVTIKELNTGDYYRRLEKEYNDSYKPVIGRVMDIKFNGEDAIVYALEVDEGYSKNSVKEQVFTTKDQSELTLFVGDLEDYKENIARAVEQNRRKIEDKEREIADIEAEIKRLEFLSE